MHTRNILIEIGAPELLSQHSTRSDELDLASVSHPFHTTSWENISVKLTDFGVGKTSIKLLVNDSELD